MSTSTWRSFATISSGFASSPSDPSSFESHQTYTEKPGQNALVNKTFAEVIPAEYDAVYCAGGRSSEYICTDLRVQDMVRHFDETGKPIFTICHGVQMTGRKVAGLGACAPEVRLAGGTYIDLSPTEAYVDRIMVSAKGWTALAAFMRECLNVLGTKIIHSEDQTSLPMSRERLPA